MSVGGCCGPAANDRSGPKERTAADGPLVEILYFDGCPNHHPAMELVERVSREVGITPDVRLVNVPDQQAAQRLRFLGSPTIRVDGVDVEPLTEERDDYALSCRIFRTEAGFRGQPDERWVRGALQIADDGEGRLIGSRRGFVHGKRLEGTLRWLSRRASRRRRLRDLDS